MSGNNLEINLTANASGATAITKGMADMERGAKGATEQTLKAADAAKQANDAFEFMVNKRIARLKDLELREKAAAEAARRTAPTRSGIYVPDAPLRAEREDAIRKVSAYQESERAARATAEEEARAEMFRRRSVTTVQKHNDLVKQGMAQIKMLAGGWLSAHAAVVTMVQGIEAAVAKSKELKDLQKNQDRSTEDTAADLGDIVQNSSVADPAAIVSQIMQSFGRNKAGTEFAKSMAEMHPNAGDAQWKTALRAAAANRTVTNAGTTSAALSGVAGDLDAGGLADLTRRYLKASGGKAIDQGRLAKATELMSHGISRDQALAMVAADQAQEGTGAADGALDAILASLRPSDKKGFAGEAAERQRQGVLYQVQHYGLKAAFRHIKGAEAIIDSPRSQMLWDPDFNSATKNDRHAAARNRDLRTAAEMDREARQASSYDPDKARADIYNDWRKDESRDRAARGDEDEMARQQMSAYYSNIPFVGKYLQPGAGDPGQFLSVMQNMNQQLMANTQELRRINAGQSQPISRR